MKHRIWTAVVIVGLGASPALAQSVTTTHADVQKARVVSKVTQAPTVADAAKLAVAAKVMRGAPYSAETLNETVQVLADGNRIVRRTAGRVYRDSEGRTRTEYEKDSSTGVVSISDPMAGTTWMLYPSTQTAHANSTVIVTPTLAPTATSHVAGVPGATAIFATTTADGAVHVETRKLKPGEVQAVEAVKGGTVVAVAPPVPPPPPPPPPPGVSGAVAGGILTYTPEKVAHAEANTTTEDLGEQLVENVMAKGTRTTTVIPAGAIGNEQPIRVVSEQWFSSELGILVLTRHSDPRSGETTYRVANISRAEPDPSLFQVPAGYKIQRSLIRRQSR